MAFSFYGLVDFFFFYIVKNNIKNFIQLFLHFRGLMEFFLAWSRDDANSNSCSEKWESQARFKLLDGQNLQQFSMHIHGTLAHVHLLREIPLIKSVNYNLFKVASLSGHLRRCYWGVKYGKTTTTSGKSGARK